MPSFQGEHNDEILRLIDVAAADIDSLRERKITLSRRNPVGAFD